MILCLGEALIDLVPEASQSPGASRHLRVEPGGAPMNVAIGLRRLGVDSIFVGTLSTDSFGERLSGLLAKEGTPRMPDARVDAATRLAVIDPTNPAAPFRFYGDAPADTQLAPPDVDAAFGAASPTGLYVGSLPLTHARMRRTAEYAVDRANEAGIRVYSDPNPRPAAWPSRQAMVEATEYLLRNSSIAKLSVDDAAALGWPVDPVALLGWADERYPARLFVTCGAEGSYALVDGVPARAVPPAVEPVDPTGAGDASFAALISRAHAKDSIEQADLDFASQVGALATQRHGAINGLPTLDEVRTFSTT